jgi:hypothetical protein
MMRIENWHPAWIVRVETPGGTVQLLTVHLRALFDGSGGPAASFFDTASDHVGEIESFKDHLDPALPTIVLGDFNEGTNGDAVRAVEARGLSNLLPLFHPGQFTWRGTSLGNALELSVDHILVDGSFVPLDTWVDRRGHSDHIPVIAHLEMPRARSPLVRHAEGEAVAALGVDEVVRKARGILGAQQKAVDDAHAQADGQVERPVEAACAEPR